MRFHNFHLFWHGCEKHKLRNILASLGKDYHGVGFSEATEEAGLALDSLGDQSSLESARKGARDRTLLMLWLTK